MENRKGPSIIFIILAIIIGSGLWREFDFEDREFKNPALASVYFIALVFSVIIIIKSFRKHSEN